MCSPKHPGASSLLFSQLTAGSSFDFRIIVFLLPFILLLQVAVEINRTTTLLKKIILMHGEAEHYNCTVSNINRHAESTLDVLYEVSEETFNFLIIFWEIYLLVAA